MLATTACLPLVAAGCDGMFDACVYNGGYGPCEEWVPQQSCESIGGVYHAATTCADLGMTVEQPPPDGIQ
jgi:hypothetical protein